MRLAEADAPSRPSVTKHTVLAPLAYIYIYVYLLTYLLTYLAMCEAGSKKRRSPVIFNNRTD